MAQVIVGLDVGSRTVRVARLRVGFRSAEVEKVAAFSVDEDPWPEVLEFVKGADLVYTALPGDTISLRQLEFPKAAAKRLDQILPIELDGELPFDMEEMVLGFRTERHEADRVEVLVAATARERVEDLLGRLGEVGINPREVAAAPVVLAELGRRVFPTEAVAMVDVGHRLTDIAIVERGEFKRARTSSFGGEDVSKALGRAFGVPEATAEEWKTSARYLVEGDLSALTDEQRRAAEAVRRAVGRLSREIRQTLAAHSLGGGEPVGRVLLCGAGAKLAGFDEFLSSELGMMVEFFALPPALGGADQDAVGGAKALALALSGTVGRGQRINLRQGELAFEGEVKVGRGLIVYALLAVVVVMVFWGFSAVARHAALEREREVQHQELATLSKQIVGHELDDFGLLQQLMVEAAEKQGSSSPIPENDAFDVVEELSKRIPASIEHEIDSLDIRSGRVQLKGRVTKRSEADEIREALSQWEECFLKVPAPRTTPAVRDKRLQYTMDIESRCP